MTDLPSKMSGGEQHEEQRLAFHRLKNLIEQEGDVHRVRDLRPIPGTPRWAYLIETPFATYPKFVVGSCNDDKSDIIILSKHSAEWGALASFEHLFPSTVR